jgi:glycosyltransferase involved in cell wall biosynthesis
VRALAEFEPDCVAIWSFNPTMLMAWTYARVRGKALILGTDGCLRSDQHNTPFHTLVRRAIVPTADAYVGTSRNSRDLFVKYGAKPEQYFNCWLFADNARFAPYRDHPREYDLMFSGQFIERKLPHFFVDVVERLRDVKRDVSALLIGDGPLRRSVVDRLDRLGVRYSAPGFLGRAELPRAYASARLLLFPTKLDAYGVVANEALAVGTPVIANEEPGAVGELVLDGRTGLVLPLDARRWAEAALRLLQDSEFYRSLADAGFAHVQQYTDRTAADGLRQAFEYAVAQHAARRRRKVA